VTSAVATLTINVPPTITTQPQSEAVSHNDPASFSVSASGTAALHYQWSLNGTPLPGPGATSSTLTLAKVKSGNVGSYTVVVTNSVGSVTSAVAVLTMDAPPFIITQPQNQTVNIGQNASFSVGAIGLAPVTYQWSLNGSVVAGATNSTLALTNIQTNNAGSYTLVLANNQGSVTSMVATLTVNVPPGIATQPQSQTVTLGQNGSFSVLATGTAPLSYQWSLNGTALAGATTSALTLANLQATDAGSYTVLVTNIAGSITSAVATVTVTDPVITLSLSDGAGMTPNGFTFQFSVPAGLTYVILASTNCQDWTPIFTNVAVTGSADFTDTAATNYNTRLYRLMVVR
jgi:hypothetical protein